MLFMFSLISREHGWLSFDADTGSSSRCPLFFIFFINLPCPIRSMDQDRPSITRRTPIWAQTERRTETRRSTGVSSGQYEHTRNEARQIFALALKVRTRYVPTLDLSFGLSFVFAFEPACRSSSNETASISVFMR